MQPNPDPDWGPKALAEMDRAEAELMRVHAEVQAAPALIENANRRFRQFVAAEQLREEREREERQSHV